MNEQEVLAVLGRLNAVIKDSHVVYKSGKHGSAYVNKDAIYPYTAETSRLCHAIAERFADDRVEVVIAPAIGGVILSQWTAHHLSSVWDGPVLGIYAEKETFQIPDPEGQGRKCYVETGLFVIQRGYDRLIKDKRVLVVEDVLTTGGSVLRVIGAVRAAGGEVVGVGALCNRGGVTAKNIGDPPRLHALVNVQMDAFDELGCPLCHANIPINTDVGHGKEFLSRSQA